MKAVILAGGEGTRLRPLTCRTPKPMVRLFDRPVLEHIIALLKKHGFEDIAATLMYLPHTITDYFGDGSDFGVRLSYFTENEPLGTAGGVRSCSSFFGQEDFMVISGDAVCDFDLRAAFEAHKSTGADATMLLYRHPSPLEYGLVMTESDGRVTRFIEKPSWSQVFSDSVNTGIYILSPKAIALVPEDRAFDFSKQLFPLMLERGMKLLAHEAKGYWCDMGDCAAYLQCAHDALAGRLRLDLGPQAADGAYSQKPIPAGVTVRPPCYISPAARLEPGAFIGPFTALHSGASVGSGSAVEGSIIGGSVGRKCSITRAVTDTGSAIGDSAVLMPGSVIGTGARISADAQIHEGVRVWPDCEVEKGARVWSALTGGEKKRLIPFENGVISGAVLTPEFCARLGGLCAAGGGKVGIGGVKSKEAAALVSALASGVAAAGGEAYVHDASFAASAACLAPILRLDLSLYADEGDELFLRIFDKNGFYAGRDLQRKLENGIALGTPPAVSGSAGGIRSVSGADSFFSAAAASSAGPCKAEVTVYGFHPAADAMREALSLCGCRVTSDGRGLRLGISEDGFELTVTDENGREYDEAHSTAAVLAAAFAAQPGRTVSVGYSAPAALDVVAAQYGGSLLRLGRDGERAAALFKSQAFLRDGIHSAAALCFFLTLAGMRLSELSSGIPDFAITSTEIACESDRGGVMRALADRCSDMKSELFEGLRVCLDGGWVQVTPCSSRQALRIISEGANEEFAEELCAEFAKRTCECDEKRSSGK